jgi:predicted helicase
MLQAGLAHRVAVCRILEWVIDQYRVTKDDQGQIMSDPNRLDDEQYIVHLIS